MSALTWDSLRFEREQRAYQASMGRCSWIVETCASTPTRRHVKPCYEPATVCTLDGGIPRETFCGEHGSEKEKQGVPIYLIEMPAWYGTKPFRRATFRKKAQ